MKEKMFCFQCQETAKGTGCTITGVCGKSASTSSLMDVLLFATRGVAVVADALHENRVNVPVSVSQFVDDALFATITNANFDEDAIRRKVKRAFDLRNKLVAYAESHSVTIPRVDEVLWHGTPADYEAKAEKCGVMRQKNEDLRSLKELTLYGLKGAAAYLSHARALGFSNGAVDTFILHALAELTAVEMQTDELVKLVLETGQRGLEAMALLDKAHTDTYGKPVISKVELGTHDRPGILVSGHDLHDLDLLLQQSRYAGIDVYTHGEMLPAHYYPLLKRHPHLVGNYGSSWWRQREDFSHFNGPILFTTNCIVPPSEDATYRHRIFTTNAAGFRECTHIVADEFGNKDFSLIIELAKRSKPPAQIEQGSITGGFAHDQVSQLADKIAASVKAGHIRKFVVMAGCDGRMQTREYYTQYAQQLPHDCIILTAGCAKYRYNKLHLGEIDGIPRVLDAGQCNDAYSWILTAYALRDLFQVADVNQLPIVYNIAWYEQKAVIVLLALLSIGIRNIHLGPTLPAFLSPNVASVLSKRFGISTIDNVDKDLLWVA